MCISQTRASIRLLLVVTLFCNTSLEALSESSTQVNQPSNDSISRQAARLEKITVVGSEEAVDLVPGSAHLIDRAQLAEGKTGFDDVHRVLREVPGVNIQEEDGYGLRPNIGFRGVSVERSANITLMEDGVLIAPAPYSAPSAYYFPSIGRMESVEVLKGAGQIKYGPRTTGGSLNMLSTSIPGKFRAHARLQGGEDSTLTGHIGVGQSWKYGGVMLETYQAETDGFKKLDGGGDTGYDLEDYVGKFRVNTDPDGELYQEVEVKLGYYNQESNETYLGLTQGDFDTDPFRRYAGSQLDNIDVEHDQYTVTHYIELGPDLDLSTTLYRNDTSRNWFKLEKVAGISTSSILDAPDMFAAELAWIQGANSPDDAFALRNNRRRYESKGVQSALGVDFEIAETQHSVEFGVRYHEDDEDRFQEEDLYRMDNGTLVLTSGGASGSQANRIGEAQAWAFHVQDEVSYREWTVTPGLRYENISYHRDDFGSSDPMRLGTALTRSVTSTDVFIPGIGVHYQVNDAVGVFVGVHKGFAPPGPAKTDDVDEEESVNYEAGVDFASGSFGSELVLFLNDYDNLLGADTLSSGGSGSGDLFNGGEATTFGVEASAQYNLLETAETEVKVPARLVYTYTNAEFDSDFDSDFFGAVQDGDRLPYIPEHQLGLGVSVEYDRYAIGFDAHYVDAMATVAGSSGARPGSNTDSYFVVDAKASAQISDELEAFVSIKNLFDEEYVVARRPAGARPGIPLMVFAGVSVELG